MVDLGPTGGGRIIVTDDALIIEGIHFEWTPNVINSGSLNLLYTNNYSSNHASGETVFSSPRGRQKIISNNVFGARVVKPKPWWRFW